MAYNKEKILKQLLSNIEDDQSITSFEDAAESIAPDVSTLYTWEFEKLESIKGRIQSNKIKVKKSLRRQWRDEKASPTLQLALYKLLSTDEERKALAMEYREHSGEVAIQKIQRTIIDPVNE